VLVFCNVGFCYLGRRHFCYALRVTTLTFGLRLNVNPRAHEVKNVFRCETHFHKLNPFGSPEEK
jgi:hypothetical protein